nr:GGDEF domain-containing protein [Pararhizobium capsulatum]
MSSGNAARGPWETRLQSPSPAALEEVHRLLAGRTRDIRLSPELTQLFRERSWPHTAKIIRAWMFWVIVLDVLMLGLNAILLTPKTVLSMLLPASCMIPAALVTATTFARPQTFWVRGVVILSGVFLILLCLAFVGIRASNEFYERHLTIMLFVAVTAIIIFPIPVGWTTAISVFALGLFLLFQLRNPNIEVGSALAGTLFFACGVFATVVARRTIVILAHKTFLLELRDRGRLAALTDANTRLELLARTDPLTGVANRRSMAEMLDRLWSEDIQRTRGVAMLMCDVDEFKKLNDSLGHAEGDRCLVKVAGIIRNSIRDEIDQVARYGGEEFLVLLPGADEGTARTIAERIRSRVEAARLPNPASRVTPYLTVSIGIAVATRDSKSILVGQLQRRADAALYAAKNTGRNCVLVYADEASRGQI